MDDDPTTISIDIPPVLHGYVQRLIAAGQFTDAQDYILSLLRREFFQHVADPTELRGLVSKKVNRLAHVAHPKRCALCEE